MKQSAPRIEAKNSKSSIKNLRPGLCLLAQTHKAGCFTQAPCKSKCIGAYFFCLPCQLERSFGRPFKVTQESANSYQKLNKPLRFDSAEQRSGACGGRQTVGAKAETLPVDAIAPWVKLIQTGRGGSRQCVDKVALNFKSKAAQINFCAAFFLDPLQGLPWHWIEAVTGGVALTLITLYHWLSKAENPRA